MSMIVAAILAGLVAGLVASAVMSGYQAATAGLFGQDQSNDDPANVKAADDASKATTGKPVTQKRRQQAGSAVHYATGAALGIFYAVLVLYWPLAACLFGVAFGVAVAVVLDDLVVPAFGWGPWPWATPLNTHLYGLTAHAVFGAALEGVRRLGLSLLT
ncbi:MAG: DUF1440 domain-containing protein [Pseudomonadota bacterium]